MIQKVSNSRLGASIIAPMRQGTGSDGPETWGQWSGRKHYSLEVVQNPLRARMCGFGDKDRRPLAPAAVAKMIVRREDNTLVDVDEVDCSFFLVTVDLWSADGKHEMNLVLHPTSADRYVPSSAPKIKRRATGTSAATAPSSSHRSSRQSPAPPAPPPSAPQYQQSTGMTPYMAPSTPGYNAQGYPFPPQQSPVSDPSGFQAIAPYGPPSETPTWGYTAPTSMDRSSQYSPPALPSIHSIGRDTSPTAGGPTPTMGYSTGAQTNSGENWHMENSTHRDGTDGMSYRTWPQDPSYSCLDNSGVSPSSAGIDPSLRGPPGTSPSSELRDNSSWPSAPIGPASATSDAYSQEKYSPQEPYGPAPQQSTPPSHHPPQPIDTSMYASASYAQQQHHQQTHSQYQQGAYAQESTPPSTIVPLPRHTYTRTLVGPLSANACRLLDEHRKSGIFFLFQDLSIRTEGTFRLRLRLMNVGAPPAPEPGALRVHTDMSPVLAQTFTEPFVVYSAKRFPGVPDTTALSIALGNQGQKLPLRNRNGTSKMGRKRRRSGSDVSGDESD